MEIRNLLTIRPLVNILVFLSPVLFSMAMVPNILGPFIGVIGAAVLVFIYYMVDTALDPLSKSQPLIIVSGKVRIVVEVFILIVALILYLLANYVILSIVLALTWFILYIADNERVRNLLRS